MWILRKEVKFGTRSTIILSLSVRKASPGLQFKISHIFWINFPWEKLNSLTICDKFQNFPFCCLPWVNPANWCLSWEGVELSQNFVASLNIGIIIIIDGHRNQILWSKTYLYVAWKNFLSPKEGPRRRGRIPCNNKEQWGPAILAILHLK